MTNGCTFPCPRIDLGYFQSYEAQLDRHSFPTRRSSDLFGTTPAQRLLARRPEVDVLRQHVEDRKSTRLNSSHANISYAVFCLKRKKRTTRWIKQNPSSRPARTRDRRSGTRTQRRVGRTT